ARSGEGAPKVLVISKITYWLVNSVQPFRVAMSKTARDAPAGRPQARKLPGRRWRPETGSRAGTEAAHRLLVFIHPRLELLVRKEPRLRQRRLFLPQAPGDEQQQFRPFCRRQLLGGAFDFGQRFHGVILPSGAQVGNRTLADPGPTGHGEQPDGGLLDKL